MKTGKRTNTAIKWIIGILAAAAAADAFKKSRRFMPLSNRAMNITLLFSCLL